MNMNQAQYVIDLVNAACEPISQNLTMWDWAKNVIKVLLDLKTDAEAEAVLKAISYMR